MSAALKLEWNQESLERPSPQDQTCVTSAPALWKRICGMADREKLAVAVCLETSLHGRGRRRRPTQERIVIVFRTAGRLRVFDPGADPGPLREVTGPQDLKSYFDDTAGFSYVVVR
jgi:hypothetical protein